VPYLAIVPKQDSVLFARLFSAVVTACDSDGTVRIPHVWLNATRLSPTATTTSVSGCYSARQATYSLVARPGRDTIRASVTDGYHDSVTVIRGFTYDPALEVKPVVSADLADALIAASTARVDTFRVRNPGPVSATYSLSANCTALGVSCTVSPSSLTLAPGDYGRTQVSYTAPASGTSMVLRLRATYVDSSHVVSKDSATTLVSIGTGARPTIAMAPSDGTTSTSASTTITVSWHDTDDALSLHQVWVNGLQLADTYQAQTEAGYTAAGLTTNAGIRSSWDPT